VKKIIPSVSVILEFEQKLFIVKRQNFLNFFPGYTTFPGGKIENEDYQKSDAILEAARREIEEELGFDFIKLGYTKISHYTSVVTPDFNPYRFETHFLKVHLTKSPVIKLDPNEALWGKWMKPQEVLEEYQKGIHLMVPPMRDILESLKKDHKREKVELDYHIPSSKVPIFESQFGLKQILPYSNTLPPADRTTSFHYDDVLVDPSPKDEEELERFIETIKELPINKVFITHHHPDHNQFCDKVASFLKADLYMSRFTRDILLEKKGESVFGENRVHLVQDGDQLGSYLGQEVLIMAVPGHDAGQLALYPKNKAWFIASDLFQGVGTVVIPPREGNMREYFQTLNNVIQLNPNCVYPSHGIPLGGVQIFKNILEHRQKREDYILKLYEEGKTEEEMRDIIYSGLDKRLHRLALVNIYSHLQKLSEEGIINWKKSLI
jgi:ribonuclease/clavin/mitogillin